jgi:CRP-like cAMP-binding protein
LHELLVIAEREGKLNVRDDRVEFTRPTQHELAARIGTCREVVSRLLRELDATEDVSVQGRTIRVSQSALATPPE